MTTRITVPAEARASWELADRWKAKMAEVRAGGLVLKGNGCGSFEVKVVDQAVSVYPAWSGLG
ncbi:hypothetical protein [Streptomyces sp. A012304]|uniref:hypothetical protein n=1 Tax=Streptomyces sp. A012304 TaxID=375446 RepID=UPI0022304904|nr:hypothetical protein [Streptomyces sp. A012304]GKQ40227.1 hypothetical protein ALMP_67530 [Streptomyces sp. A012304]